MHLYLLNNKMCKKSVSKISFYICIYYIKKHNNLLSNINLSFVLHDKMIIIIFNTNYKLKLTLT